MRCPKCYDRFSDFLLLSVAGYGAAMPKGTYGWCRHCKRVFKSTVKALLCSDGGYIYVEGFTDTSFMAESMAAFRALCNDIGDFSHGVVAPSVLSNTQISRFTLGG